jgi:hypothetical protein
MCVDCVLASSRIAQVDPGRRTPSPRWFYHTPTHMKGSSSPLPPASWSGVASTGGSYVERLEGDPPSAQRHFDRHPLTEGPCQQESSALRQRKGRTRARHGRQSHPHSISSLLEDADLVGTSIPRFITA